MAQSPYPLRVLPARPLLCRSVAGGAGRSSAVAGRPAEFEVAAHDEYGNRWFGEPAALAAAIPLEALLSSGGAEVAVAVQPTRDGRFLCSYTGRPCRCICSGGSSAAWDACWPVFES